MSPANGAAADAKESGVRGVVGQAAPQSIRPLLSARLV